MSGDDQRCPPEERELFRAAVGPVRRLPGEAPAGAAPSGASRAPSGTSQAPSGTSRPPPPEPGHHGLPDLPGEPAIGPGDVLHYAAPGVRRSELRRLRRGQIGCQGELDLHGHDVERARAALAAFLAEARERRLRCVRVIHGKGLSRGGAGGGAVLKSHLDRWLRLRPEVAAFCSARPAEGGTGALYVLLRR